MSRSQNREGDDRWEMKEFNPAVHAFIHGGGVINHSDLIAAVCSEEL